VNSKPPFVAFDVETTGLVPGVDRIVEVAAVAFQGEELRGSFAQLVDPGMPMPSVAQKVNGITDQMLGGMPTLPMVLPDFLAFLGQGVPVAHNATFDVGFVAAAAEEAGLAALSGPVLDTRELARRAFPRRQSYSLASLARDLRLEVVGAHRALADAHVCRLLFLTCARQLTGSPEPAFEQLFSLDMPSLDFADNVPRVGRTAGFLKRAMLSGADVRITYRGSGGEMTERRITPQSFTMIGGNVAVIAFCHLRGESRTFHLGSIIDYREDS